VTALRAAAIVVAIAVGAIGLWRGTWAVGGSDSSCYALMAQAFASSRLQPSSTFARDAPWPDAATTVAPGGFIPSPVRADAASPVCAPGFALLLAPLHWAGGPDGIFFLTPIAGTLLIYLTFLLATQWSGERAGLAAAVLLAATPVFIFQLVQPMNDVVVAMLWSAISLLTCGRDVRPLAVGALTGLAILIRPNLAPAALLPALWYASNGKAEFVRFVAGAVPGALALLVLNALLYGHALSSGYGPASSLFSPAHVWTNLANYGKALLDTQLAFPLLGFVAVMCSLHPERRGIRMACLIAAVIMGGYLFYRPLPEWWYLRFLLPALAILTALGVATVVCVTRRSWLLAGVVIVVSGYGVTSSAMGEALDLQRLERRFRITAEVARDRLPGTAVFLTVWESGSIRFHAGRDAILWDSLEPAALELALSWLGAQGREPFLILEDWEEPIFRSRFSAHSPIGNLDWPPRFAIDRRVKIYQPSDRARYWSGGSVPTEVVFSDRR
jgi:hypothetical protein